MGAIAFILLFPLIVAFIVIIFIIVIVVIILASIRNVIVGRSCNASADCRNGETCASGMCRS